MVENENSEELAETAEKFTGFLCGMIIGFYKLPKMIQEFYKKKTDIGNDNENTPGIDHVSEKLMDETHFQILSPTIYFNKTFIAQVVARIVDFLKQIENIPESDAPGLKKAVEFIQNILQIFENLINNGFQKSTYFAQIQALINDIIQTFKQMEKDNTENVEKYIEITIKPKVRNFVNIVIVKISSFVKQVEEISKTLNIDNLKPEMKKGFISIFTEPFANLLLENLILADVDKLIHMAFMKNPIDTKKLREGFEKAQVYSKEDNPKQDILPQSAKYRIYDLQDQFPPSKGQDPVFIGEYIIDIIGKFIPRTMNDMMRPSLNINRYTEDTNYVVRKIQDRFESLRYFFGFLLGLFDIIEFGSILNLESYYSKNHNPYDGIYAGKRKIYDNKRKRLKISNKMTLGDFLDKNSEFQNLHTYLDWLINKFKPIRIHAAHHMPDTAQDLVNKGLYKIFSNKEKYQTIPIGDLYLLLNEISGFIQQSYLFIMFRGLSIS